jgi:hypothetical protein
VRDEPYEATLLIEGSRGITLSLPVAATVHQIEYGITLDPPFFSFTKAEAHNFTLTNTGSRDLNDLIISLEGADSDAFVLSIAPAVLSAQKISMLKGLSSGIAPLAFTLPTQTLASGASLAVSVRPAQGLSARKAPYTAELRVKSIEGTLDEVSQLSFAVASTGSDDKDTDKDSDDNSGNTNKGNSTNTGKGSGSGDGSSSDGSDSDALALPDAGDVAGSALLIVTLLCALAGIAGLVTGDTYYKRQGRRIVMKH